MIDEDTIARIYYLILKKQYNKATKEELEELRDLILEFFEEVEDRLHYWLALHGVFGYNEFYEIWSEEILLIINEYSEPLEEDTVLIENEAGIYFTMGDLLYSGLQGLYEQYRNNFAFPEVVDRIKKRYKAINQILLHPEMYSLSQLIIQFDHTIDLMHKYGNFIEDYMNIDVEYAKELAEEMFNKEQ